MALADVIDQYVTAFGNMTGIVKCYADPPDSMSQFPCAMVYVQSGEMNATAGGSISIHTIVLEVHHSQNVLPKAVDEAKVWPERVMSALYNGGTFGGYVTAVRWPITYEVLGLSFGGELHYGMRFSIPTKVIGTL